MHISHIDNYNVRDVRTWSGIPYFMVKNLENEGVVVDTIDLQVQSPTLPFLHKYLWNKVLGKRFDRARQPSVAQLYAQKAQQLIPAQTDVIMSSSSVPMAFLKHKQPKIFYTDATFGALVNFYEGFDNLCNETLRNGHALEKAALDNCSLAIYASDWAAQSALQIYKADPAKVKVVPFGANIDHHRSWTDIKDLISHKSQTHCQLLLIGKEWERKGGPQAVAVAQQLNDMGLPTTLHLVGIQPNLIKDLPNFVVCHGYLNKANDNDRQLIYRLLAESHFLIQPSLAECYGIMLCEAASFGLPSVATRVGGIPTIIKDGVNGQTFDLNAEAAAYAHFIYEMMTKPINYQEMASNAYDQYQKRLNWQTASQTVLQLIKEL
jgi:glycosyltransferase involved in cell wall biosynthesis